jgi:hypothetical protein
MMAWLKGGQGWTRAVLTAWMIGLLLLWLSGVVLRQWPSEALLEMSEWAQVLRRAAQVLHGVCAWAICLLSGRGLWPHLSLMWKGRARQHPWWWGCASLLLMLVLSVSGLMLLYGTESLLALMSALHFWIGLLLPLVLTLHVGLMKRRAVRA